MPRAFPSCPRCTGPLVRFWDNDAHDSETHCLSCGYRKYDRATYAKPPDSRSARMQDMNERRWHHPDFPLPP